MKDKGKAGDNGKTTQKIYRGKIVEGFDNPAKVSGLMPPPRSLATIKQVRLEMARVYRCIFEGKITINQGGSFIVMLDRMVKAIKDQIEVDTITAQYQDAWSGFEIVAPTDADARAQEVLPPPKIETETEEDDDEL